MTLTNDFNNLLSSLKQIEKKVLSLKNDKMGAYFKIFPLRETRAIPDFGEELTTNIAILQVYSGMDLSNPEIVQAIKKATHILIEDVNLLRTVEGKLEFMNEATNTLCTNILRQLSELQAAINKETN